MQRDLWVFTLSRTHPAKLGGCARNLKPTACEGSVTSAPCEGAYYTAVVTFLKKRLQYLCIAQQRQTAILHTAVFECEKQQQVPGASLAPLLPVELHQLPGT